MSGMITQKILVVDDDQVTVTYVCNILRRAKYEVISATEGKKAVELAVNFQPNLIILDIVMPDMEGSEIADILSSHHLTSNIPIIFLTGILTKDEEKRIVKNGNYYVMAKPTTGRDLLIMVNKVLSNQQ